MPDALLYARHVERRQREAEAALSECGYDRLLIHSGRPRYRFRDDHHPPFRAHPPFVSWAPLPWVADCLLEIRPGSIPRLWYCQPEDFWHLPPDDPESWWADSLDVKVVAAPEQWRGVLRSAGATAVIGENEDFNGTRGDADVNPGKLLAMLEERRTDKTAWERDRIAAANRVAAAGHLAAAAAFGEGASELEIHLAYLAASGQDPERLPYGSIVGLNEHAAVLHYQHRDPVAPDASRSFLIDAGADCHGYASDVTRTTAGAGESVFSGLVTALDELQQRLVERVRAGQAFPELHHQALLGVAAILEHAGIVDMRPDDMVESGVAMHFLPHGLGHFLGVQVHDVAGRLDSAGQELPPPEAHPSLRLTRVLEPGNVLTIEPGLYFIPMLLAKLRDGPWRKKVDWRAVDALTPLGGVRVEDNVLVTEDEPINYTRQAFRELGG